MPPTDHLDLASAESLALRHAPEIAREYFRAQAAREVVTETRARLFPQVTGDVVAVGTGDTISKLFGGSPITSTNSSAPLTTRLGATGGLNDPTVLSRESNGLNVSQLITDFGRTPNLIAAARFSALSAAQQAELTRAQVLLLVDTAYFRALEGEALVQVANETVSDRQLIVDQTSALVQSQLKSDLDASLAQVNLEQARLLQLDAETRLNTAFADLSVAIGYKEPRRFVLAPATVPAPEKSTLSGLLGEALRDRPDAIAARYAAEAAARTAAAERAAFFPKLNFLGAFGRTPTGDEAVRETYAAAGLAVELPVFDGGEILARAHEAEWRAKASRKEVDLMEDRIAHDVDVAWLNLAEAEKRIGVSSSFLANATEASELAQSRYQRGVVSLIELSEAELAKTQAQIENATATYEYDISRTELEFQIGSLKFVKPVTPPRAIPSMQTSPYSTGGK